MIPKQHHPNCELEECSICLADCMALLAYLEEKSGVHNIDHLGSYRAWLDKRGIESESEYGWPLPLVFNKLNIDAYLEKYK